MLPPTGIGVVGLNASVTDAYDLCATRSLWEMPNDMLYNEVLDKNASIICTSASESLTLYTSTYCIAKSDFSKLP